MSEQLSDNQREILEVLFYTLHVSRSPLRWCTPLDLGGRNGSHHSGTLRTLARRGLVQFKQRGAKEPEGWDSEDERGKRYSSRGSKCYRITRPAAWQSAR